MSSVSIKVAFPIILAGVFIVVVFIGLNYQDLNIGFWVILSLLIIYIFLFGFATGQNFALPIKKLLQRADDLSRGNVKSRLYIENKDELGQLAGAFNKIAAMLEESKEEAANLQKSVDLKVKARTQVLEETIDALDQKVRNRTAELEKVLKEAEQVKKQSMAKEQGNSDLKNEVKSLKKKLDQQKKPSQENNVNKVNA